MKHISNALLMGLIACVIAQPASAVETGKSREQVLWSFCSVDNCPDGNSPAAGLIAVQGMLYGTTKSGGAEKTGTVFSLDPETGTESVVYSFCRPFCEDGQHPFAKLLAVGDTLYGTASQGSRNNGGTVFSLDLTTGTETGLWGFCYNKMDHMCYDGETPLAELFEMKGILYSTTTYGGRYSLGTISGLDPKTGLVGIYSFEGGADGSTPQSGLTGVKGLLYGTTATGGTNNSGQVFALDPKTWMKTTIYSFCGQQNCADGNAPIGSMIAVKGKLYGTTSLGGASTNCDGGCGTVFVLDATTGQENVLYSFCGQICGDGSDPTGGLIDVKDKLYGTTVQGGAHCPTTGCGAVFAIDLKSGLEKVLYSFCADSPHCTDGKSPNAGLVDMNGTLYGTALTGGAYGQGVVFAIH